MATWEQATAARQARCRPRCHRAACGGRRRRLAGDRRLALVVVGAVLPICSSAEAGRRAGRRRLPGRRSNILLVTLDTTRADHLGSYGSTRARTRHMDRLAAEGVRFEWAFSPAPITLPAHASLLTGLYPFAHGVRNNGNFYLGDQFETLATILKARGYRTAAFVSSFILDRRYGLARGFDTYDDRMEGQSPQVVAPRGRAPRRSHRAGARPLARDGRARTSAAPFFAWLHLYDPHEPYRPPPPFREAFADAPVRRRDRVRRCDRRVGRRQARRSSGCSIARWSPSSATTARAWATTARRRTRCSCTTARSGCR